MQDEITNAAVLIVDDEAAIRYSVSKTLQRAGYEVHEAESGEHALALLKARPFDVILTDIRMPTGSMASNWCGVLKRSIPIQWSF